MSTEPEIILPRHKCGLYLTHNQHKDYYQSASDYIAERETLGGEPAWADDEAKARALATDEIWELQWYPRTPISSYSIAAPTLNELLALAREYDEEINKEQS